MLTRSHDNLSIKRKHQGDLGTQTLFYGDAPTISFLDMHKVRKRERFKRRLKKRVVVERYCLKT